MPPSFLPLSLRVRVRVHLCMCVCVRVYLGVLIVPAADAHTTVRIIHANKHQRERFFQRRQAHWG